MEVADKVGLATAITCGLSLATLLLGIGLSLLGFDMGPLKWVFAVEIIVVAVLGAAFAVTAGIAIWRS